MLGTAERLPNVLLLLTDQLALFPISAYHAHYAASSHDAPYASVRDVRPAQLDGLTPTIDRLMSDL